MGLSDKHNETEDEKKQTNNDSSPAIKGAIVFGIAGVCVTVADHFFARHNNTLSAILLWVSAPLFAASVFLFIYAFIRSIQRVIKRNHRLKARQATSVLPPAQILADIPKRDQPQATLKPQYIQAPPRLVPQPTATEFDVSRRMQDAASLVGMREPKWTEYTEDYLFDVIWRWHYRPETGEQAPLDITPYCKHCRQVSELDFQKMYDDNHWLWILNCDSHKHAPIEVPDIAYKIVEAMIEEKLIDGSWRDTVRKQREAKSSN